MTRFKSQGFNNTFENARKGFRIVLKSEYKSLDGMNGDISGYALTIGELCAVAAYALI